jgi:LemA protein
MTAIIVVWIIIFLLVIIYISIYNGIISSKNKVEESKSSIDVFLQNRYDLIPNLVETVKQYMQHEKGVLEELTRLRTEALKESWTFTNDRFEKENQITQALKSIFAVAENYPDLKANQNFIALQNQWSEIEDNIAAARRTYNAAVKDLNDKKQMIPYSIVAGSMNLPDYAYFQADENAKQSLDAKDLFSK